MAQQRDSGLITLLIVAGILLFALLVYVNRPVGGITPLFGHKSGDKEEETFCGGATGGCAL